ncbi:unnamed protein product [Ectocarpus sp. 13 AM-2016]
MGGRGTAVRRAVHKSDDGGGSESKGIAWAPGSEEEKHALLDSPGDEGAADGNTNVGGRTGIAGTDRTVDWRGSRLPRPARTFSALLLVYVVVALGLLFIPTRWRDIHAFGGQDQRRHFAFNPDCPYVLRTPEERLRMRDPAIPGSVLTVDDFRFGRLGNRFWALGVNLKLGYCCKSKLVSLPPKDGTLAPGIFGEGTPGPRWYDFTNAPDVEGFDASSCPADITWGGREAFHLLGLDNPSHPYYTPNLSTCVETVPRLTGCEAAYFFPMGVDVCLSDGAATGNVVHEQGGNGASGQSGSGVRKNPVGSEEEEGRSANTLVMHVRSGDIFVDPVVSGYGQPPLQYYVRAVNHQKWDRVDIVTNGRTKKMNVLNPVIPALEVMFAEGELTGNIHFHKDRTMEEDFLSMMCVDGGLVTVRSSLSLLLAHHSSASRLYFPRPCAGSLEFYTRGSPDASLNDLDDELQGVKVYGVKPLGMERYSLDVSWNNTADQMKEMLTFNVSSFEQCGGFKSSVLHSVE